MAARFLIVTQAVDSRDPILGFFVRWIEEFGKHAEHIDVVCLKKGEHRLPANVFVHSLGKEKGYSRIRYVLNFYRYIWKLRSRYDTVFVHMNQEYVLLGGLLWRLWGKKILLWRNHKQGNFLTDFSVLLSHRTFATSPESYIAHYKKTSLMPVGIDTDLFRRKPEIEKIPHGILFLGRLSPVKNVDAFIRALAELKRLGVPFEARIVGDPAPVGYADAIKRLVHELDLEKSISFQKGVPHAETANLYNSAELYVNLTPSGSMDKTIFEAMACETPVLVFNRAFRGSIDTRCVLDEGTNGIATRMKDLLEILPEEREALGRALRTYSVEKHSLKKLAEQIAAIG